jgi:DNA-binding IscR family transcriptional regulator
VKISTRTRYGVRALLDLATNQKGSTPVPLRDISERLAERQTNKARGINMYFI